MTGLLRDTRTDRWPKKIILFSHHEVTICFEHLKRALRRGGISWEGGGLMDLFQIRDDPEIRYILTFGFHTDGKATRSSGNLSTTSRSINGS